MCAEQSRAGLEDLPFLSGVEGGKNEAKYGWEKTIPPTKIERIGEIFFKEGVVPDKNKKAGGGEKKRGRKAPGGEGIGGEKGGGEEAGVAPPPVGKKRGARPLTKVKKN